MKTSTLVILIISSIVLLLWYFLRGDTNSAHLQKPHQGTEEDIPEDLLQNILNSEYTKGLDSLRAHITGHNVVGSTVGNAGFILNLDNNTWASAYRVEDKILSDFGSGAIPAASMNNINSAEFGDGTVSILDDAPYAHLPNDIKTEVAKSHGKLLEGLSIGDNTFNFAFAEGMELEFQLCTSKEGKPAIRVFWEQW
jgi:hypothetical protein